MGLKFKPGQEVVQVVPAPIEGTVAEAVVVDDHVQYRVEWAAPDGSVQSKFFTEEQLQAKDAPAA